MVLERVTMLLKNTALKSRYLNRYPALQIIIIKVFDSPLIYLVFSFVFQLFSDNSLYWAFSEKPEENSVERQ